MEGRRAGGGAQSLRDLLAERCLRNSGSISVRLISLGGPPPVNHSDKIFRKNLEALGNTSQIRTFHGAQCICDLGTADPSLCNWKSCGVCSIIKSSFTAFEFGATSNSGRYGKGIYSYFDPSMADRFATSSISSPYRAILACEVNVPAMDSNASRSPLVVKSVSAWVTPEVTSGSSPRWFAS